MNEDVICWLLSLDLLFHFDCDSLLNFECSLCVLKLSILRDFNDDIQHFAC